MWCIHPSKGTSCAFFQVILTKSFVEWTVAHQNPPWSDSRNVFALKRWCVMRWDPSLWVVVCLLRKTYGSVSWLGAVICFDLTSERVSAPCLMWSCQRVAEIFPLVFATWGWCSVRVCVCVFFPPPLAPPFFHSIFFICPCWVYPLQQRTTFSPLRSCCNWTSLFVP